MAFIHKGELIARHKEFYRARECRLVKLKTGKILVVVKSICPKLTSEGCSMYKDRPQICKDYDGRSSPAIKNCLWRTEL